MKVSNLKSQIKKAGNSLKFTPANKLLQTQINRRPRKKLGFEKLFQFFFNFLNHNAAFAG